MRDMLGARCTLVTTVATSAAGRKYAKLTSVAKSTREAAKLPAGIVVHVAEVPGQQIIAAAGVKVEAKAAGTQTSRHSEPQTVDEADIPF